MSFKILSGFLESVKLKSTGLPLSISGSHQQVRYRRPCEPRLRTPYWRVQQLANEGDEKLTYVNQTFLKQMAKKNYELSDPYFNTRSPLNQEPLERKKWAPGLSRSGVIGIKLGTIPQWFKDGTRTIVTLIEVVDNHVINYIPPGLPDRRPYAKKYEKKTKGMGNLVIGAVTDDPQKFTREYCELFSKAGVLPKKILTKFPVHPDARLQIGTPLYAGHFQVGDVVDVTGTTINRGFQGVMKRWGFHGMPATHGQTKTHRRPGNIGAGGEKGRVWPGKKMPGHVGNKTRTARCLQIMRINHKLNILYVFGIIPGDVNSFVYVHDTVCKPEKVKKKLKVQNVPHFPTYYPEEHPERPEEEFYEKIFNFLDPSITFTPEKTTSKKK